MKICQRKKSSVIAVFIMAFLIFQTVFSGVVFASGDSQAPQSTSFSISFNDDGTANITEYKYKTDSRYTSVVIPNNINGIRITGISEYAFEGAYYLESIVIPEGVKEIGYLSFSECMALKEITIPGSVSRIETFAFLSCWSLERVFILYGVQSIGDGAFADCTNLTSVAISPSTTDFEDQIFDSSDNIVIQANPDSAAGQYTGYDGNITSVELPSDSPSAYQYTVDEELGQVIIDGYVGTSDTPIIPDQINSLDVVSIGDGAFENKPITQITLPASLKTIGANAFVGTKLTVVEIPSTVTGIGAGAFNDSADITLKGDSSAIDDFLGNSKYINFIPWGPGRTKYHQVTIESTPHFGGAIIQGRTKEYREGNSVTIEALAYTPANEISSDVGTYIFEEWLIKGSNTEGETPDSLIQDFKNDSKITITMPSYDVTLTAKYKLIPPNPLVIKNGVVLSYAGGSSSKLEIPEQWRENVGGELKTVNTIGSYGTNNGVVFLDPSMKELVIPSTIKTILPVVFNSASGLEAITVDDNNEYFESEYGVLFNKGKTKLLAYPANKPGNTYKIPDTVKEISPYAFYRNRNLKKIYFSNIERIGTYAFANSALLNDVEIPSSVSYMDTYAFYNCRSLDMVSWEENSNIDTIRPYTFAYCPLTKISLPSGEKNISVQSYAFAYCKELNSVTLSDSITDFSSSALYGCNKLKLIIVDPYNTVYSDIDGILFSADKTVLVTYPMGRTETSYEVPDGVKIIDNSAFGYAKFTDVTIPESVEIIRGNAFSYSNITSIDLQHVKEIGGSAFYGCKGIEEVIWPEAITEVPSHAFAYSSNIKKVVLPDTVTSIGHYAFSGCSSLTDINLPDKLNSIGACAFSYCSSIKEVNFPDSLNSIGDNAYGYCYGLTYLKIPSTVVNMGSAAFQCCSELVSADIELTKIPHGMFYWCGKLSDLKLSEDISLISNYAFSNCRSLNNINIGNADIDDYAFEYCYSLDNITVGGSSIGSYAFSKCSKLSNVVLLNTVNTIGSCAFSECNSLTNIAIPESVSKIGYKAFNYCEGLKNITIDENNKNYADENGVLFNKDKTNLIFYPQNKPEPSYTTINTVKTVSDYAFESANNLTEVYFTDNVSDFGLSIFSSAPKMSKFTVNNSTANFASTQTYPAETIFYGISDSVLKNLVVYGYIGSTIEDEVFVHRIKGVKFMALDSITNGLVIQKIEKNSSQRTVDNLPLDDNTWLGEVVGYKVPDNLSASPEAKNVIIPSLVTNEMQGIIIKDTDGNEITLNDGESIIVSSIGYHALWYPGAISTEATVHDSFVKSISSVVLPKTITDIKTNAFENCTGLNSFNIPYSVQNIYPYAFRNCSAITEITIPENVAMLGEDKLIDEISKTESHTSAFVGCTNLKKINVDPNNKFYASIDGVLMNYEKSKIYEAPNGFVGNVDGVTGKYVVPDGIEAIGSSAFAGCKLNNIEFSASVNHVGISAFEGVLTEADSIISFKQDSDTKLDIDNRAFADCSGLTEVILPPELDRIGDQAFDKCTSLRSFRIPDTSVDYHTVDGVLMTHTISDEGVEAYIIYMYPLGKTEDTYTVPEDIPVRHIYIGAFQNNKHLRSIVLSDDVEIIDESAFRNCSALDSITWGERTKFIQPYAFAYTALKDVSLPESISNIGEYAFAGCGLNSAEIYCVYAQIGENAFNEHSDEFVLRGFAGSKAEDYAKDNNLTFEALAGDSNSEAENVTDSESDFIEENKDMPETNTSDTEKDDDLSGDNSSEAADKESEANLTEENENISELNASDTEQDDNLSGDNSSEAADRESEDESTEENESISQSNASDIE